MVYEHFLTGTDIKFLFNQGLGNMPRQLCITGKRCLRFKAPAFICIFIDISTAQSKGRHFIQKKVKAMIVIYNNHNVWVGFFQPFLGGFIAVKETFPVWFLLQAMLNSITHCWYV